MNPFRRGAHHQTGYRPTVDEIAADIKRQANPPTWRKEIRGGVEYFVTLVAIAPPGGVATLPALPTAPANPGVMADA